MILSSTVLNIDIRGEADHHGCSPALHRKYLHGCCLKKAASILKDTHYSAIPSTIRHELQKYLTTRFRISFSHRHWMLPAPTYWMAVRCQGQSFDPLHLETLGWWWTRGRIEVLWIKVRKSCCNCTKHWTLHICSIASCSGHQFTGRIWRIWRGCRRDSAGGCLDERALGKRSGWTSFDCFLCSIESEGGLDRNI